MLVHSMQIISEEANGRDDVVVDMGDEMWCRVDSTALSVSLRR